MAHWSPQVWAAEHSSCAHRLRPVRPGIPLPGGGAWQGRVNLLSLSFLICEMGQQYFLPCQVKAHTLSTNGKQYYNYQDIPWALC